MTALRSALVIALSLAVGMPCLVRGDDPDPDAPDLPILRTFGPPGHSFVYDLGFSADGRILLITKGGQNTCPWDVETGKRVSGFDFKVGAEQIGAPGVHSFGTKTALSPNGRVVALDCRVNGGTYLGALNADSGKLVQKFFRQGNMIWSVFSPDSTALVAGYDGGGVMRWDIATGKAAWDSSTSAPGWGGGTWRGAFSPDGKTVAADFSGTPLRLLDAVSGKEIAQLPWPGGRQCQASALAYSPDSRLLAISGCDLQIWDVATAKVTRTLPVGADTIGFSPDGRTLVVWYRGASVRLFEVASGKLRREIKFPEVERACVSPVGSLVALASKGGTVYLCDWRADREPRPTRLKSDEAEQL